MPHTVLITGGTGLVGTHLSRLLREKGYQVRHLSRKRCLNAEFPAYAWDIKRQQIDEDAIDPSVQTLIHLAGAGVANGRWTAARKAEILDSRIASTHLLIKHLSRSANAVKTFIGASATGYYGNSGDRLLHETDLTGDDTFLSRVTHQWEQAYAPLLLWEQLRCIIFRIGVVLAKDGGALPKMSMSATWGIAPYFGKGIQYMPWIHISDMCNMFLYAIENNTIQGTYNAVAPQSINNKDFMQILTQQLNGKAYLLPIPAFVLRIAMGEMADAVLDGCRASADKIQATGFQFQYPTIGNWLK